MFGLNSRETMSLAFADTATQQLIQELLILVTPSPCTISLDGAGEFFAVLKPVFEIFGERLVNKSGHPDWQRGVVLADIGMRLVGDSKH